MCEGGDKVKLLPHFWRANMFTAKVSDCLARKENCVGGYGNNVCKIGHIGANCEACDLYNQLGNGHFGKSCNSKKKKIWF